MLHPTDRLLALQHPLLGAPCPVTGLKAYVEESWIINRPDYRMITGILEPGIVLSLPIGNTRIWDTDAFFRTMSSIRKDPHLDRKKFVVIEDYRFHTGSDYEGRLEYIRRMVNEVRPIGMIFFTQSAMWKLSIRLGLVIGRNPFPVRIANSYEQALHIACEMLKRPLPGISLSDDTLSSQWKVPHYSLECIPHPNNTLEFRYQGMPQREDVLHSLHLYETQLSENQQSLEGGCAVIHNVSLLKRMPLTALRTFLFGLFMYTRHLRTRRVIVVHPNIALRAILLTLRPFFKSLTCVCDISQALEIAKTPVPLRKEDLILGAMKLIESMEWDVPGFKIPFTIPLDSPYENLAYALSILKQDVDRYLNDRELELEELEHSTNSCQELSLQLQKSLNQSEEDHLRLKDLSLKNSALTNELSQSQREIFHVLTEFVDQRSGESPKHSIRISRIVARIAQDLQWSTERASALEDAGLLHDIGFLGIEDTIASQRHLSPALEARYQEHCNVGFEVLSRIKGNTMSTAATAALTHHERWDGTGYPIQLMGCQIPEEGRIIAIGEFLVHCWDKGITKPNKIQEYLLMESAKSFDPRIVSCIQDRIESYMDVIAQ